MEKINKVSVPMREQSPSERIKNFKSVPLGYSEEEAKTEAQRCLQCPDPVCEAECPVSIKIKDMIKEIGDGNFKEAFLIAKRDNPVPAIAGRVCPQEDQCEGVCTMKNIGDPINIGKLEAFIADWAMENKVTEEINIKDKKEKVAIVGSGPAGISCAADLRKLGYQVSLFEALHKAGGVLQYGIPAFRLPKEIVEEELSCLEDMGVDIQLNRIVGQNVTCDALMDDYDAVFIGTGAGAPKFLGIKGEKLMGAYSANEFLIRTNLMKSYKFPEYDTPIIVGDKVAVIGAGNVAMDAARCAIREGAKEVYIVYRRTINEAPARNEEIHHAIEEGIKMLELVNPVEILGNEDGWVSGLELQKMKLGEEDSSGRPRPVPIENSNYRMEFDTVIEALGTIPNRLFLSKTTYLKKDPRDRILVEHNLVTNIQNVYAGGDAVRGNATVILALGDGRKAAASIHKYLGEKANAQTIF
ncbi:NADPH-dependent glutamate synthase [bacterium]|nr:NADPH-dependent glutamate synthase [bacterium]